MSASEIKKWYESLRKCGDLLTMFPNLTGDWIKDKKDFTLQYHSTELLLNDIEADDDDFFSEDEFMFNEDF